MSDRVLPRPDPPSPEPQGRVSPSHATSPIRARGAAAHDDSVLCDRCGAAMFRMHAVWRCSACGYKTDCCGW
ncbi:MAG: hypothetical protein ACM4AI_07075 [Acidobacteriota bacterium]